MNSEAKTIIESGIRNGLIQAPPKADSSRQTIEALRACNAQIKLLREEINKLLFTAAKLDEVTGGASIAVSVRLDSSAVEAIQELVCKSFRITIQDMLGPARPQEIVWPRQVAAYLCRRFTEFSLPALGRMFGGRDHGTILHAIRAVRNRIDTNRKVKKQIELLEHLVAEMLSETHTPETPTPEPQSQ